MNPFDAAREIAAQRFPEALAAMLVGSAGTAHCTATSDLDILFFLDGPPAPFRHTTRHAGWIVELFVHTPTSYQRFIERETRERRSPLLHMCGQGRLLVDPDGLGAAVQEEARHLLEAGPAPLNDREREDRRYALTDQLDDLAGCQNDDEMTLPRRSSRQAGTGTVARRVLDQSGGPLREGYHRTAPTD
ncbi:MAG: nucleotidyltransferase domain-containing protein [Pseudonocardiaceae bacterium]